MGAEPPLRRRRKKQTSRHHKTPPRNASRPTRLNRRYQRKACSKGQSNSPAQRNENRRCIADFILRNSGAYFVKPQTRRQAGKTPHDPITSPPALRQVWWLCKNRVRSFAQLNRRYTCGSRGIVRCCCFVPYLSEVLGIADLNGRFVRGSWERIDLSVRLLNYAFGATGAPPPALRAPLPKGSANLFVQSPLGILASVAPLDPLSVQLYACGGTRVR